MRKTLIFALILFIGALLIAGCSSTSTSTKLVTNASAAINASTAASLAQEVNDAMAAWTSAGSVSGTIVTASIKAAALDSASVVTGPDAGGYYHVTEEVTTTSGTYEADLYVKLVTNEAGQTTDTYIYGTFVLSLNVAGSSLTYTMTFGSGSADPYHGTATWTSGELTSISAAGPLRLSITTNDGTIDHTTVMTISLSGFSLPVTAGADYPTGTMTITMTYDGTTDANTYTIVYNGTSTAAVSYGSYSTTITVPST
ncbi:MAG: hypothetical protein ABIH69_03300 [bacterium]